MGSIALRRLTLFNFRSFQGLHTLDFPASGLVILRGENRDTTGDSGAGKTNILLAIAYAFGYCRHSAKALQCWYDDAPMYVEVELDTPEGVVAVRRGIKGVSIGSLKGKSAEAKLDQVIGVPPELREILTYRDQVKPKQFLAMGDAALKEFLVEVLQLHGLEKEVAAAVDLLGKLGEKHNTASIRLLNVEEEHGRCEQELEPFNPEDTHALEAELGRLQVGIDQARADLQSRADELTSVEAEEKARAANLAQDHEAQASGLAEVLQGLPTAAPAPDRGPADAVQTQLDKCELFLSQLEAADQAQHDIYDRETQALRQRGRVLHNELARVPGLLDDVTRLTAEIEKLERDNCDRCGRQWDNAKLVLAEHRRQVAEKEAALAVARTHKQEAAQLDAEINARRFVADARIEKMRTVRSNLKAQLAAEEQKLKSERQQAALVIQQARARIEGQIATERALARAAVQEYLGHPDLPSKALRASQDVLKQSLNDLQRQLAEVNGKLALVRQANSSGLVQYGIKVTRLADARRRVREARAEAEAAEQAWKAQSDYVDLLKGFRNKIFDEVLEAVGSDATAIIATLPNAQHVSVEFRSERETQKAKVQEKITAITYLYGEPRPLDESVSGGQLTSIGLAVDLAVAGVISRRLGCHLNWIVLDEAFEGHDTVTKTSCLEMLQTYAADKLVVIVDHASELKEMFSKEIRIVFENKLSTIRVGS
jgi:ABC-type dipeptide/oligopeptide/nickel transport system ATPase subunit